MWSILGLLFMIEIWELFRLVFIYVGKSYVLLHSVERRLETASSCTSPPEIYQQYTQMQNQSPYSVISAIGICRRGLELCLSTETRGSVSFSPFFQQHNSCRYLIF